jgi:hypothetical protein
MFEEYSRKARLSDRVKRWLLIFPSVVAFGVILGAVAGLYSLRSQRQAKQIRRMEDQTRALLNSIRVGIAESGFVKRSVGGSDLYVPMLTVVISNVSASTIEDLVVAAYFVSEGIFSCQSSARIFRLGPGETTEAGLKCIEPTGFGSVITGISLSQTMQPVSFSVLVHCGAAYATVEQGKSTFKLLWAVPPISAKD